MRWVLTAIGLFLGLSAGTSAHADQLIQIPTADIVPGATGEYLHQTEGDDAGYGTVFLPAGKQYELMFRWYNDYAQQHRLEGGGQFQILPDGVVTPGLAVGMWDVTNSSPKGRRAFLMLTKHVDRGDFSLPKFLPPMQLNFGVGSGKFSGPLAGLRIKLPAHLDLVAEYDARRLNAGLWYSPIRHLTLKAELQNGEFFFGGTLRSRF
jgi:hypothetical protein